MYIQYGLISALLFAAFLHTSQGLSCNEVWECASGTDNYNFVSCVNGTCQCKEQYGFSGNATESNPCACDGQQYWASNGQVYCKNCAAPSSIYYDSNGVPHCADVAACEAEDIKGAYQKNIVYQLYSQLVYPMPLMVLQNPAISRHLFADNVHGRITPVGVFDDFAGTLEYFYALAASSVVQSVEFIFLYSSGNTVSVRVDIFFNGTDVSGRQLAYNLTETGFFFFDDEGKIKSYDLAIPRIGQIADVLTQNASLYLPSICQVHEMFCNGTDKQYASFDECMAFMFSIPYGTWDNAMSNTGRCRIIHSILVPFDAHHHCPHIGPTGGGKCVDRSYESWYDLQFP